MWSPATISRFFLLWFPGKTLVYAQVKIYIFTILHCFSKKKTREIVGILLSTFNNLTIFFMISCQNARSFIFLQSPIVFKRQKNWWTFNSLTMFLWFPGKTSGYLYFYNLALFLWNRWNLVITTLIIDYLNIIFKEMEKTLESCEPATI